jgi:transcriptional regulator with XRE-family HTH domain
MDAVRFGRQFRALRVRLEKRQSDVSTRARLSRSLIGAIDRGELDGVTVGALVKAAAALGADVDLYLRWRGERLDRLVDEAHAALVDTFVLLLQRLGWIVEVEVSFSIWGERGSIDILAFHPQFGALLIVEIKSVIADSQATLHGLDRKARLGRDVIQGRAWDVRHVSRLLVIGATATSRRRVARLAATYDATLPERGTATRRWLRRPDRPLAGLLFLANDRQGATRKATVARERVRRPKTRSHDNRNGSEARSASVASGYVDKFNLAVK